MLKNIDLRLVSLIGELNRTRSVSAAAQKLSLSQSTVSMALARLRKHFDDPLFVRTSTGMDPTPRGAELIEVMKNAEFYLHQALEHRSVFDPLKSTHEFRLCSTDIAQLTLLPTLMNRLRRSGPSMSVTLQGISDRTYTQLE
jgi:DNA-binding transcriptional LysR family regulator